MTSLILPRRSFITGAASLIVAPSIVRASSLMDINSLDNRVIVAWRTHVQSDVWFPSRINSLPYFNDRDLTAWVGFHNYNEYKLMRRGDVTGKVKPACPNEFHESMRYSREWFENYEACQSKNYPDTWLLKRMEALKTL